MRNSIDLWAGIGRGISSLVGTRARRPSTARRASRCRLTPQTDRLEGRELMSVGLDPTFGFGGVTYLSYPLGGGRIASVGVTSSALQSDGKIVLGGSVFQPAASSTGSSTDDLIVLRLNPDGSLDTSFGSGGRTVIGVQSGGTRVDSSGGYVAIQSDGKILVGGTDDLTSGSDNSDFVIARLTAAGALDTSFNSTGIQTVNIGDFDSLTGLAIAPDGKVVAAGSTILPAPSTTGQDFAVARLTTAGALDTSFNGTGKQTINFTAATSTVPASSDTASGVVVQSDGKIVVAGDTSTPLPAGSTFSSSSTSDFAVARLNGDGSLDTSFNGTGKQTVAFDLGGDKSDAANAVTLQANGAIVLAGYATESTSTTDPGTGFTSGSTKTDIALARLTPAGALDTAFGSGGKVVTQLVQGGTTFGTNASSLAIAADGTMTIGGDAGIPSTFGSSGRFALIARYTAAGALDPGYGTGGVALLPGSSASSIVVDPDGKVVFVDSSGVKRTTQPEPAVVSATYTVIRKGKSFSFNAIQIKFNTKLNALLAGKKGNYQIRVGTRGKKFITIKRVTYDAATNSVTLFVNKATVPSPKTGGLFVLFTASGVIGSDSQALNGGNNLTVKATAAV